MGKRMIVLCAMLTLLLFGASGAGEASTFTDPQGDAVAGAADITQVVVSNDLDGNITFAVSLADRTTLTPDDLLFIFLNTDKNTSTGVAGIDYAIVVTSAGAALVRASGTTFAPAPHTTLTLADNNKTIKISRSELGDTTGIAPMIVLTALDSNDVAEDAAGPFAYDLELKPVLDTLAAKFAPAKPKHGKVFRLATTNLRLDDGTVVKADSITCVAKLNGKRLAGRCSWRIPANARGKQLVVTLTARYKGVSATFTPWRFRVG